MRTIFIILTIAFSLHFTQPAQAAETRNITFPVIGPVSYSDDFGAARSGHTHEGNDLIGKKLLPLVAAVDGTVRYVAWPEPSYGYYVSITDSDGYIYNYVHINNDTPGTDNGLGGGNYAYAPYIESGNSVVAGQLIGWMGDSGNAETVTPHLHFEIRQPDDTAIDPYEILQAAKQITTPVIPGAIGKELLPYGEFTGGASLALGNFDDDKALELVTAAGPGGGPNVRVLNTSGSDIYTFFAYQEAFVGGVDVAVGDINGDGTNEIITGMGPGGTPRVKVFTADGRLLHSWLAYKKNFSGGVQIAVTDLNDDGKVEIVTGPGAGIDPQIKIFTKRGKLVSSWLAYDASFEAGVDVAADGSTSGKIIIAPSNGAAPHIQVFSSSGKLRASFLAYDENFFGGVRVSVANNTITTVPASAGYPELKTFDFSGNLLATTTAFEDWWMGGYFIAQTNDALWIASGTGGRRTSVQKVR